MNTSAVSLATSLFAAAILLAGCGKRAPDTPPQDLPPPGSADTSSTAPPAEPEASVTLNPTQGNTAAGELRLASTATGVRLTGTITGLAPNGEFGFHVHENGDCSAPDASSAGPHFNPNNAQHGNPAGDAHHAGDMTNLTSDAQGTAQVDVTVEGVTLGLGQPTDVDRRAVVVHEKADDYTSQPAGNSGSRIACGVIGAGAGAAP